MPNEPSGEDHGPRTQYAWRWLTDRFGDRRIAPETVLERDLGFDSMDWLHLALDLEQETGIVLTDAAVARTDTVDDLMREVAAAPGAGHGRPSASFLHEPEAHLDPDGTRWLQPLTAGERRMARVVHGLNRTATRVAFRLHVEGAEAVSRRQVVFAPTHGSYLDAFVLTAALDYDIVARTFWAADTRLAFGKWLPRRASRLAQAFPFDADHGFIAGMTRAAAVLNRGHNLIWFPEGWLTRTGKLQEFMSGIGMLLERYPVPVVPIAIGGAHEAYPKDAILPRPHPITVAFGESLDPRALQHAGQGATVEARIASALRRHTAELYERTRSAALDRS